MLWSRLFANLETWALAHPLDAVLLDELLDPPRRDAGVTRSGERSP
ncbi:MAG: hypothetical protein M3O70_27895 [Actinomycetota bacterium]|nr:hypothetical protein [Actinomycetota bacterium]